MELGLWGISYQTADSAIRDEVYFTDTRKIDFLNQLEKRGIDQGMILSTCNRCELYFFFDTQEQFQQAGECFQEQFPTVDLRDYWISFRGEQAMEYLFRVTCGIESLVLGEDQILGQVKEALAFSQAVGASRKELTRVVRDAVSCAKDIKTSRKISEVPLSVSYVGIQMLKESCGIEGKRAFVIGSGKMAALALRYLYEYGVERVLLCSRKTAHAKELLHTFPNLEIVEYDCRYQRIPSCDIVVSATSAPHIVLRAAELELSQNQELYLLDLAMPRDIDGAFGEKAGCHLINMDTLTRIVARNRQERERLAAESEPEILAAVGETLRWLKSSRVDHTIQSLQQRCSEISESSYRYLEHKLNLCDREKKLLKKVLDASLIRLMREPIQELKKVEEEQEQANYQQLLEKLFRLNEEEEG